jgi:hypothetical protein
MTIDLGDELADYGKKPTPLSMPPNGSPVPMPRLKDLQAQGFNTDPPPGFEELGMIDANGVVLIKGPPAPIWKMDPNQDGRDLW